MTASKIRRRLKAPVSFMLLVVMVVSASPVSFGADFRYADISSAPGLQNYGTYSNPVPVASVEDLAVKYMKIKGFGLGRLYYKAAGNRRFPAASFLDAFECVSPFMVYVYGGTYKNLHYIEVRFLTPQYVQPAIDAAQKGGGG